MKYILLAMLLYLSVTSVAQKPALTKGDYEETPVKTTVKKHPNTPIPQDSPELQYFDFEVIAKDKVKITKCHLDWQEVEIPASVVSNGYKFIVTELGDSAFYNKKQLKTITIPNSITSMGRSVFEGCSSLTFVTIPNGITSIKSYAFCCCSSLISITIPNNVTSIGKSAFASCSSLTSITIPNGVTSIEMSAFFNCSSLTSITIPNSVTSIEPNAFYGCSSLTSITIPNSVTSIGSGTFSGCSSLAAVHITNLEAWCKIAFHNGSASPLTIARNLYLNGELVRNLVVPNSVTKIGEFAFCCCSSLTSITIPNSVTSIGKSAFASCSSLTSITIPNGVTSIEMSAFFNCSSLTSITIPNSVTSIEPNAFYGCSSLTSITIPNSVTSIGDETFFNCSSLTSITIPEGVTTIGKLPFRGCSSLDSITWNAVNCSIDKPFEGIAKNIKSFTFGQDVTNIPDFLCDGMSSLTNITIPANVKTIGKHVFRKCDNISSVTWNAVNCEPTSWSDNSGYYYGPFYDIRGNIEIFNIGENVVILPAYLCFQLGIKTLIIPQSVTTIGDFFIEGNYWYWWRRNMTILFKGKVKFTGCITGNADIFKGTTTIVYVPNNYLDYYKSIRKQVGFKYADIKPQ